MNGLTLLFCTVALSKCVRIGSNCCSSSLDQNKTVVSLDFCLLVGELGLKLLSNILELIYFYKSIAFILHLLALLLLFCFALVSPVSVCTIHSDLNSVLVCVWCLKAC